MLDRASARSPPSTGSQAGTASQASIRKTTSRIGAANSSVPRPLPARCRLARLAAAAGSEWRDRRTVGAIRAERGAASRDRWRAFSPARRPRRTARLPRRPSAEISNDPARRPSKEAASELLFDATAPRPHSLGQACAAFSAAAASVRADARAKDGDDLRPLRRRPRRRRRGRREPARARAHPTRRTSRTAEATRARPRRRAASRWITGGSSAEQETAQRPQTARSRPVQSCPAG